MEPTGQSRAAPQIRFDDGAAYEEFMGVWSRLAGESFLQWLAPPPRLRWADVGCGNGAFTALLLERCAPHGVQGLDPSAEQLDFARTRFADAPVQFRQGDAMALPWPAAVVDVAVMPLVIFFVPDPARGVAEMARVVRPGGTVAAYAWDMAGGGFPYDALLSELTAMEVDIPGPPHPEASRLDVLESLWLAAGLGDIDTTAIAVERTFDDFDDYWVTVQGSASVGSTLKGMPPDARAALIAGLTARLSADADGRITCRGVANAIRGRVASAPR